VLQKNNTQSVSELFRADPERGRHFCLRDGPWRLDFSRLPLDRDGLARLCALPGAVNLRRSATELFSGRMVNPSENRPALHMALRGKLPEAEIGEDVDRQRHRFLDVAGRLHDGKDGLTDLLHIGIGGSDLGPRLVADALDADDSAVRVHWLSTLDSRRFDRLISSLDPSRTGVVVASKSFSTSETLMQATAVREWLGGRFDDQAWAATARVDRAVEFGLSADRVLTFPEWTGGRFSLWSSVGVSAAARIGAESFTELLAGAAEADRQFVRRPDASSLAVMIALTMHFLRRKLDLPTLGLIAYEPRLGLLSDYLQQLIMESLGKGVDRDDRPVGRPTAPLVFGGRGTDLQHSIMQALHQGPDSHPLILVGSLEDAQARPDWQRSQLANLFGQAEALARGRDTGQAFQYLPGNRPVALLLTQALDARGLGYLLASFEHAVYALSVFWNINPFDQWGVEEGKRLAGEYERQLAENPSDLDDLDG
jgi:glucose-6-phosphate isomerase